MAALCAQLRAIASASTCPSPASRRSRSASSQVKNSGSPRAPYLTTSARPARSSRAGRLRRVVVSAITARGGWKAPTRFLPWAMSTAVLPPTEESTIASRVVGSCTQSMPRIQQAAVKPARSPTTPPPRANTVASRVAPSVARESIAALKLARVLCASPAGMTCTASRRSGRARRRASATVSTYSGATWLSLSSRAWRPRACAASRAPSASRPGPMSIA